MEFMSIMLRSIRKHLRSIAVTATLASLLIPALGSVAGQTKPKGQTPQKPQTDDQTLQLESRLVQLDVNVIDHNNATVTNLRQDQFQVFEDKVSQQIDKVKLEEVPVSVGLV